jgi:hypothetical protein
VEMPSTCVALASLTRRLEYKNLTHR